MNSSYLHRSEMYVNMHVSEAGLEELKGRFLTSHGEKSIEVRSVSFVCLIAQ